jgi:hypothetical protein
MMDCLNKTDCRQIKLLLGHKKPASYYAWGEEIFENLKNAGQLDPPRMLDSKCVKHCGLKTVYLAACHSDASVYSLTNPPEWLHGGLWYFQLPQLFALANSMNVLDRIAVVGYDESFLDDVIIAFLGQEVTSLTSFNTINFEGVWDHTEGGKSNVRCNNIHVTYGYAKQGFESDTNEDGLHSPSILNNIKSKPLIGKQYLVLSSFVAEFCPHEKHYDCSSNLFHARNKYP